MQVTRHFNMSFSQDHISEPLLHRISNKFDVEFNIHSANVSDSFGHLSLSFVGEEDELKAVIQYLEDRGVELEEVPAPVNA